ncbi:MAG: hypothetical protein E7478_04430, partial [Ruminococcaceae bacterium]|nr:hypothetical protein [Oscillospiraceae bacterium]
MKKTLSFAMAMITALSCTSFAAAANTSASEPVEDCGTTYVEQQTNIELENALRTVKTRISIPEELTEFNYRTSVNNTKTVYTFT